MMVIFKNKGEEGYENTPLNAENLNSNFNELSRNILTATITEDYTLTQTGVYEHLPLVESSKVGNKLSVENGNIVLGEGVNIIAVSYTVHVQTPQDERVRWASLFKDGSTSGANAILAVAENISSRSNIVKIRTLVSVSDINTLSLGVVGTTNDLIRSTVAYTSITVEVIN